MSDILLIGIILIVIFVSISAITAGSFAQKTIGIIVLGTLGIWMISNFLSYHREDY